MPGKAAIWVVQLPVCVLHGSSRRPARNLARMARRSSRSGIVGKVGERGPNMSLELWTGRVLWDIERHAHRNVLVSCGRSDKTARRPWKNRRSQGAPGGGLGSSCHAKKTKHFSNVFAHPRLGSPSHTTRFLVAIPVNCQFALRPIQLASPLLSRYEARVGESEG